MVCFLFSHDPLSMFGSILWQSIRCQVRDFQVLPVNQDLTVTVTIGFFSTKAGQIRIVSPLDLNFYLAVVFASIIPISLVFFVVVFIVIYYKAKRRKEQSHPVIVQLDKLKTRSATENKQGGCGLC